MKKKKPTESQPVSNSDFTFGLIVYGASVLTFLPLTRFLVTQTVEKEQLLHAFFILAMAGAWLVYERRMKLRPVWELGRWARGLLIASYALIATVYISGWSVLMIPSFCLAVASGAIWAFGERLKRFVGAVVGAFALFQGFVLLLPALDWPLRGIAGRLSGTLLEHLGKDVHLALNKLSHQTELVLRSDGQPFIVAPECNGFGVIASSLLLALLLVLYRRISIWTKLAAFAGAGLAGLLFNAIRITIIVLLAPVVGQEHYLLMHEIVGVIVYYAALIGIWLVIERIPTRAPIR